MQCYRNSFAGLILVIGFYIIFPMGTAHAASHTFTIEYDGTNFSYGSGSDPLVTDLNSGDDITYILTAAGNDYWQTTREYWHFAFLNITTSASGGVTSTGTVSYSLNGTPVGSSAPQTLTNNTTGLAGSTFTLPHPSQFDTITITSHVDSTENTASFRINNYLITELDQDWVSYQQDISGTISGNNSEQILVSAFIASNGCEYWGGDADIIATTLSASNGTYSLALPANQEYYLRFDPQGGSNANSTLLKEYWTSSGQGWNCGMAESFNPTTDTSDKNITLETGTTVTGTIFGNNSEPIFVSASFDLGCYGSYFDSVDSTLSGSYSILVPNNQQIVLNFDPQTGFDPSYGTNEDSFLIPENWTSDGQGTRSCSQAEPFNPTTDTSDKNILLESGSKISGVVFEEDGSTPTTNESFFSVDAWTGNPCDYNYGAGSAVNRSDGSYEILLPSGTYYIATGGAVRHFDGWWTTSGTKEDCNDASPITVGPLQEESGKNFSLKAYRLLEDWNTTPALDNGWGNSYDNDFQVFISGGELHHVLRPYSATGSTSNVQARTRFKSSTANDITTFQSTVRIDSIANVSQTPEIEYASAEFFGFFYNENAGRTSAAGDIYFIVRFGDRGNGLEAWYYLTRIDDANYATETVLATGDFTPPGGGWQTGIDYTLQIAYDGSNDFIATLGGLPTQPTATITGPARGDSAYYTGKWIRTRIKLNQAFTGDPDTRQLHAVFDDVQVDSGSGLESYDNFDGIDESLSLSEWHKDYLIGQATVTNNMLKMGVKAAVGDTLNSTHIVTRVAFPSEFMDTDTLQIDMKIEGNPVSNSARTELHAGGSWGNGLYTSDTEAGYDGNDGKINMFARIEKERNESTYRVVCDIAMNDKIFPEGYQPILFDVAPAQPDTMYTVYLRKKGTTLECNIMNAVTRVPLLSVSKDVTTAGISFIAPFGESKDISVRTRNAPAEVIGYFDNIYVTEIPGDINLSGKIDLVDVILGLQVLSGMNPAGISISGDFNDDGKVGMEEVLHDLRHVSK